MLLSLFKGQKQESDVFRYASGDVEIELEYKKSEQQGIAKVVRQTISPEYQDDLVLSGSHWCEVIVPENPAENGQYEVSFYFDDRSHKKPPAKKEFSEEDMEKYDLSKGENIIKEYLNFLKPAKIKDILDKDGNRLEKHVASQLRFDLMLTDVYQDFISI